MLENALVARLKDRTARVAVIGCGYVGLQLAVEAARAGFHVAAIDADPARAAMIARGQSYIADVRADDVRRLVASGHLAATTDYEALRGADVLVVCVPTPLTKSKEPDLSSVIAATTGCVPALRPGVLVVLESTTYPGTTVEVVKPVLETSGLRAGADFALAFSPERIDPGNDRYTIRDIPKIVGGLTPACARVAEAFYAQIASRVVIVSSPTVAEMVKVRTCASRRNLGLGDVEWKQRSNHCSFDGAGDDDVAGGGYSADVGRAAGPLPRLFSPIRPVPTLCRVRDWADRLVPLFGAGPQ